MKGHVTGNLFIVISISHQRPGRHNTELSDRAGRKAEESKEESKEVNEDSEKEDEPRTKPRSPRRRLPILRKTHPSSARDTVVPTGIEDRSS